MEQTFSQDFILQLQNEAAAPLSGPATLKQMLMNQSDLGIDVSGRNVYILDMAGSVLDSSDQAQSVTVTTNILTAMQGQVGQASAISAGYMDLAVPVAGGEQDYIVYILDNKQTVNDLTGQLADVVFPSAEQFKEFYGTDAFVIFQ